MASAADGARTLHLFNEEPLAAASSQITGPKPQTSPRFDVHLLALSQIRGVGMHALRALIRNYHDLGQVWGEDPAITAQVLGDARVPGSDQIALAIAIEGRQLVAKGEKERDRLGRHGYVLIGVNDPDFPEQLRAIPNPPLWLFLEGNAAALHEPPLVAVVGTRKASRIGIEATRHLTRLILENGLGVISGLAEGIDREAHDVAAKHNARQVAVLGTGIEVRFPATNNDLRRNIVESGGVVISEYLPEERYGKTNFVQRNRIQAALASAVCPVEATVQSGTSHTVRFAADFGRPLFGAYRSTVAAANELFGQLVADGIPTFDIATEAGRSDLGQFFDRIEGQRATPLEPAGIDFWIKGIEERVRQISSYHNLTDAERRRIIDAVTRAVGSQAAPSETPNDP